MSTAMSASVRLRALGFGVEAATWARGFSPRKRRALRAWLQALGLERQAGVSSAVVAWGCDPSADVRVEDGFLRSVGLGADLVAPISWVFDTRGMYFDARQPSDLEWMLATQTFSGLELQRAAHLRAQLVASGLSKYNLSGSGWQRPGGQQRVVLVVGQVESDASIRFGATAVQTNAQLLRAVRKAEPQAWLVYKPHPDVLAGMRAGHAADPVAAGLCDELVTDVPIDSMWPQIDAVHVNTSLAGFEALLRGVPVVCHGQPFYAGWGLCEAPNLTQAVSERRQNKRDLDSLVYATLIAYPSYRNPDTGALMEAEDALVWLSERKARFPTTGPSKLRRFVLASWAKLQGRY
jgi:capsular polysaccharide export protein